MFAWSLQLFMFIQLANLPGSMKLHLRCLIWLASILNVTLKAAMSDIMKILVIVNVQPEAATRGALWKKGFLEISQNSQENVCVPASFLTLLKKRLWHRFFPVNFAKFLRTFFFTEYLQLLLLFLDFFFISLCVLLCKTKLFLMTVTMIFRIEQYDNCS